MPSINPDFKEAETLHPGSYICQIISSEVKLSGKGNYYVNWKLKTVPVGATLYHTTPISGRGAGMLKHFIHCAGDSSYEEGSYDTDNLNGVYLSVTVDKNIKPDGTESPFPKVTRVDACDQSVVADLPF